MEPGLIEQGESYSMQCCESHGKGVRKSSPKKVKYHAGVAVKNCITDLRQANCSHFDISMTLKAEEIPIYISAVKRIGQRFRTGNVAQKKGSGRPKASSCKDDHQLKFTVLKDRKRSLKKTVSRIQDLRKQDSNQKVNSCRFCV